jgi:hypothetical protein
VKTDESVIVKRVRIEVVRNAKIKELKVVGK